MELAHSILVFTLLRFEKHTVRGHPCWEGGRGVTDILCDAAAFTCFSVRPHANTRPAGGEEAALDSRCST
jgi:hypothetical protein